jgi:bifunctional non-homologous end joining protein LigD
MVQRVERVQKPRPKFLEPMECLRVEKLPEGKQWLYEVKLDGYRAILIKDGSSASLYSRYGRSLARDFPAIVFAGQELPHRLAVLDGEIVALDEQSRPDFQALQNRRTSGRPIVFYVFDVLHFEGKDCTGLTLLQRREILEKVRLSEPLRLAPILTASASAVMRQIREAGLEGIVAKRSNSFYESGRRSGAWQKKRTNERANFVIGGYIPSPSGFDALLIGETREGKLFYLKKLRAGFAGDSKQDVLRAIASLKTSKCPFVNLPEKPGKSKHPLDAQAMKDCIWVKPMKSCEVEFIERTVSGKLRHAQFRKLV